MSKKQELTPEQILQQSIYYNAFNDAINVVLEIIDKTRLEQDVKASWAYKHGWNDSLDVVVAVLKGGEQE